MSSVATGTFGGKVLGYPTENQPRCLFLSSRLLKADGLDVAKDYPKTYDDIRRLAMVLTKVTGGTKLQCGWILQNDVDPIEGPQAEGGFVERVLYKYLEGEPLVDESTTPPNVNVTSPGARKYTQLLYGMSLDGSTNAGLAEASSAWFRELGAMHTRGSG